MISTFIAARAFDANAEQFADLAALENHLDATGGAVMRLAAQILGGQKIDETAREAALAYGLAGLLRSLGFHNFEELEAYVAEIGRSLP